jgi:hypothetical protein
VEHSRFGQPCPNKGKVALPRHAEPAAAAQNAPPAVQQPIPHRPQSPQIAGHRMVVIEPLQHPVRPTADIARPVMEPPTKQPLDLRELAVHPLGHCHAPQLESAVAARDATDMRKAQKVKRLRPALPLATTPRVGETTKGNESCLLGMQ